MASLYTPAEIAEVQRVAAEAAVAEAKDSTLKEGQEAAFRVGSTVQQVPVQRRVRQVVCFRCNKPNHYSSACSAKECYNCRAIGHVSRDCNYPRMTSNKRERFKLQQQVSRGARNHGRGGCNGYNDPRERRGPNFEPTQRSEGWHSIQPHQQDTNFQIQTRREVYRPAGWDQVHHDHDELMYQLNRCHFNQCHPNQSHFNKCQYNKC